MLVPTHSTPMHTKWPICIKRCVKWAPDSIWIIAHFHLQLLLQFISNGVQNSPHELEPSSSMHSCLFVCVRANSLNGRYYKINQTIDFLAKPGQTIAPYASESANNRFNLDVDCIFHWMHCYENGSLLATHTHIPHSLYIEKEMKWWNLASEKKQQTNGKSLASVDSLDDANVMNFSLDIIKLPAMMIPIDNLHLWCVSCSMQIFINHQVAAIIIST